MIVELNGGVKSVFNRSIKRLVAGEIKLGDVPMCVKDLVLRRVEMHKKRPRKYEERYFICSIHDDNDGIANHIFDEGDIDLPFWEWSSPWETKYPVVRAVVRKESVHIWVDTTKEVDSDKI